MTFSFQIPRLPFFCLSTKWIHPNPITSNGDALLSTTPPVYNDMYPTKSSNGMCGDCDYGEASI